MADLKLSDFDTIPVREIKLMGKRCYVRELTFDDQLECEKVKHPNLQLLHALARCLCDKNGKRLFKKPDEGVRKLQQISGQQLVESFSAMNDLNQMDVDQVKNSPTTRNKRSG